MTTIPPIAPLPTPAAGPTPVVRDESDPTASTETFGTALAFAMGVPPGAPAAQAARTPSDSAAPQVADSAALASAGVAPTAESSAAPGGGLAPLDHGSAVAPGARAPDVARPAQIEGAVRVPSVTRAVDPGQGAGMAAQAAAADLATAQPKAADAAAAPPPASAAAAVPPPVFTPTTSGAAALAMAAAAPFLRSRQGESASGEPAAARDTGAARPTTAAKSGLHALIAAYGGTGAATQRARDEGGSPGREQKGRAPAGSEGDAGAQSGAAAVGLQESSDAAATGLTAFAAARGTGAAAPFDAPRGEGATPAAGTSGLQARLDALERPRDHVTVRFHEDGGGEGRLRLSLRGTALRATIVPSSPDGLEGLTERLGDLRRSLVEQGFVQPRVSVQAPGVRDEERPREPLPRPSQQEPSGQERFRRRPQQQRQGR